MDHNLNLEQLIKVAKMAAERGAEAIREVRNSGSLDITYKGARDLLTTADLAAEQAIVAEIRSNYPDHQLLAEESASDYSGIDFDGPLWTIDPVDGTTNFAHWHYQVSSSIAFSIGGETVVGVVSSPFLDEVFEAARGQGALLNGSPIKVRTINNLREALIATGFPYDRSDQDAVRLGDRLAKVLVGCRDIRRLGSAALDICWVACGRLDGYYETVRPWDMAAGALIAKEAGATVGRFAPPVEQAHLPESLCGENLVVAAPGVYDALVQSL